MGRRRDLNVNEGSPHGRKLRTAGFVFAVLCIVGVSGAAGEDVFEPFDSLAAWEAFPAETQTNATIVGTPAYESGHSLKVTVAETDEDYEFGYRRLGLPGAGASGVTFWINFKLLIPDWDEWSFRNGFDGGYSMPLPSLSWGTDFWWRRSGPYINKDDVGGRITPWTNEVGAVIDPVYLSDGAWHDIWYGIRPGINGRDVLCLDGVKKWDASIDYSWLPTIYGTAIGDDTGAHTGTLYIDALTWSPGADPECAPSTPQPQCSNAFDDDGDGRIDLDDLGCSNAQDDSEAPDPPQCANGLDDDGDGKVDLLDLGCEDPSDDSESPDPSLLEQYLPEVRLDAQEGTGRTRRPRSLTTSFTRTY